jgi:hypothetical protein
MPLVTEIRIVGPSSKNFCKTHIEKRTLDYHASQLFKARQDKEERVTDWIQRVQTLGSQFREAPLLNCSYGAREGRPVYRLRNIYFVQGLASDRIQNIVRSRNYQNFDEIAETVLVEERDSVETGQVPLGRNLRRDVVIVASWATPAISVIRAGKEKQG